MILDRDGSVFEKELSRQHVWVLSASAINLERSSQLRIINILDTCFDSVNAGVWIPKPHEELAKECKGFAMRRRKCFPLSCAKH